MLTAFVSAITGLVSGLAPDFVKIFKDSQDHRHEMELMQATHKYQIEAMKQQAALKISETEAAATVEDIKAASVAMVEAMRSVNMNTGIAWIDGFNAILRPACAAMLIFLFVVVTLGFSSVIPAETFAPLYVEATLGVLGFLFGYRSARKGSAVA